MNVTLGKFQYISEDLSTYQFNEIVVRICEFVRNIVSFVTG